MTKAFPYQLTGVRRIEGFGGRALLADEMGLGKTYQALLWAHFNTGFPGGVERVLVICPAGLKVNWQRECLMHFKNHAEVCNGRKPKIAKHRFRQQIVIINYEILPGWVPALLKFDPDLIILDEAHRIQNRKTLTYKTVVELGVSERRLLCLSGTPLTNRPAELWTILNLLRPDKYPSFTKFAWRHCRPRKTRWGWEYKGATRLNELHRKAKKYCMIRRRLRDVLKDLPPKSTIPVLLDIEDRASYEKAKTDYVAWMASQGKETFRSKRAETLSKIGGLKQLVAQLKLKAVIEWIDAFLMESNRKLLIFGIHKAILKELYERYKSQAVLINGTVTGHKRQLAVDAFQHQKRVRLCIANMQAAGEGYNMTACSDSAFIELDWTPKRHAQARARIERIGQTMPTRCFYLIAKGTLEEPLCKMLQDKQRTVDSVIDGGRPSRDLNLHDMVSTLLEKGKK